MKRLSLIVTIAFLGAMSLFGTDALAQTPPEQFYEPQIDSVRLSYVMSGRVTDSNSGNPIPYVSVSIPGSHYSTITNEDGDFTIKSSSRPERIVFSIIGYKTLSQAISQTDESSLRNMRIRMNVDPIPIREAIIIADDPYAIISAAIDKISENYPKTPELMECFYRETVQKRNRYIYISEAVSNIYKTAYNDRNTFRDRVAVHKSRVLLSPKISDTLSVKVQGGPNQSIGLDAVKNEAFILNKEDLSLYKLEMGTPMMIDGRAQYAISISPNAVVDYPLQFGTFYIDRESLAFTRIELSADMSDQEKATRVMLIRKPLSLRFKPREMSLLVNYRTENNVTRISYVRCTMKFTCDWRKRLSGTMFTAVNEMVITNRQEGEATRIPRGEAFRETETLFDKSSLYLDPEFWKDYNIIEPSESLEHALGRLKRQAERRN